MDKLSLERLLGVKIPEYGTIEIGVNNGILCSAKITQTIKLNKK